MSYTLKEERPTFADTFFLAIPQAPTKIGGLDSHSLPYALLHHQGSQKYRTLGQHLTTHYSAGERASVKRTLGIDENFVAH